VQQADVDDMTVTNPRAYVVKPRDSHVYTCHSIKSTLCQLNMAGLSTGTLDSFIISKRPQPDPVFTSQEIRDRGSIFVANVYHASSPEEAKARINHLKYILHGPKPATHEIAAWRCMVLKHGHTGLEGPNDFELRTGSTDDGESWAGSKVLKVMQNQAIIDAVVIVSRW